MSEEKAVTNANGPVQRWPVRLSGALLLTMAPFAVSPLNLHLGYGLRSLWSQSVEWISLGALLLSIAIGTFAVFLLVRGKWWRIIGIVLMIPSYGVLWFGNQLKYGCSLFLSCL